MMLVMNVLTGAVGGLGMRVVGGKLGADKKLATYVSTVVPGGVADKAGIVKGLMLTKNLLMYCRRKKY